MLIWLSFFIALALILIIAKKSLWLALVIGALCLGIFNLSFSELWQVFLRTIINPEIELLAIAVGLIPLIGGSLQVSKLLNDLVENLQVRRQVFLGFSPALMGLLPIPGGALLSAPMLIRAGDDISNEHYAAINVWFRHILILIYPLGGLLPCSKMANLNIYKVILFILPFFVILFLLGYFFFLYKIKGEMPKPQDFNFKKLLVPLLIILSAPFIHIILSNNGVMDEISLLIGISFSLIVTVTIVKLRFPDFKMIITKMKPWKYFLIIIGVFLFLHVFEASSASQEIAKIGFSKSFLIIFIGAFLAIVTGRVQLPISILIPIFIASYGAAQLDALTFAIMYVAVYIGYMISPVHPCVSVSLEFFDAKYKDFAAKLIIPSLIGFGLTFIASITIL
jgi:integral membrane protein (TIGR00529 family)